MEAIVRCTSNTISIAQPTMLTSHQPKSTLPQWEAVKTLPYPQANSGPTAFPRCMWLPSPLYHTHAPVPCPAIRPNPTETVKTPICPSPRVHTAFACKACTHASKLELPKDRQGGLVDCCLPRLVDNPSPPQQSFLHLDSGPVGGLSTLYSLTHYARTSPPTRRVVRALFASFTEPTETHKLPGVLVCARRTQWRSSTRG